MNVKQTIIVSVVGAMTLVGSTALADTLRIGVEGAYPPFSQKKLTGRFRALTSISRLRFANR